MEVLFQNYSFILGQRRMKNRPNVIFVLGGPGSGKGTQCDIMARRYGFVHLSAGDCLREEQKTGSKDAKLILDHINAGTIVPVEITIRLLMKKIDVQTIKIFINKQYYVKNGCKDFLVDGFPRNENNLEGWNRIVGNKVIIPFMLYLECDEDIMTKRILERSKTSGRTDDNEETIRKRFKTYINETKPIIDKFAEMNKLRTVNAVRDIYEVASEIDSIVLGWYASR